MLNILVNSKPQKYDFEKIKKSEKLLQLILGDPPEVTELRFWKTNLN
jgi:hypothetical protein